MLLKMIGEIKVSRDRFMCLCRLSLRHRGFLGIGRQHLHVSPMYNVNRSTVVSLGASH